MLNENLKKMFENPLLILETAAFAYSVFENWRYRLHYPLAIIVNSPDILDDVANILGIFQKRALNSNIPQSDLLREIDSFRDDLCLVQYCKGRYSQENMEAISSLCTSGSYGDYFLKAPVVIGFEKIIPEELQDMFSMVLELSASDLVYFSPDIVDKYLTQLKDCLLTRTQIIEEKLRRTSKISTDEKDARFWNAVVSMMATAFAEHDAIEAELKSVLHATLQRAYSLSQAYEFNQQIPELFRQAFDQLIPDIIKIVSESEASGMTLEELNEKILFNEVHYYVPENVFTRICEPLDAICTTNQIKAALEKAGILCTQGRGRVYRTIKKTVGVQNQTARFVWLIRHELEKEMEMSFVDVYEIRREKDEEEFEDRNS